VASVLDYLPALMKGAWVTVQVTAFATLLWVPMAVLAGLSRLSRRKSLRAIAGTYIEIFRGTSALVQLFWLFFALPLLGIRLTPLTAGVLALGLNIGAYGAEVVRKAVLAVPKGQKEAAIALNMTPLQRMVRVVFPQALVAMLPPFGNLMIELLKSTALVSLITLSDLTFQAQLLRSATGQTAAIFSLILVIYFVMAYAITLIVRAIERRVSFGMDVGFRGKAS
jgi:polar amino acid transport system permease protein